VRFDSGWFGLGWFGLGWFDSGCSIRPVGGGVVRGGVGEDVEEVTESVPGRCCRGGVVA